MNARLPAAAVATPRIGRILGQPEAVNDDDGAGKALYEALLHGSRVHENGAMDVPWECLPASAHRMYATAAMEYEAARAA